MININLSDDTQAEKLDYYIKTLDADLMHTLENTLAGKPITALVDGLNLACPMPLLKTKVALRNMDVGDSVYVLATDPNSKTDLAAFCRQTQLDMVFSADSESVRVFGSNDSLEKLDTIFHLIITKTYGN